MKRIVAMALALSLLLVGCGSNSDEQAPVLKEPVGVDVDTAVVKKMDLSDTKNYSAQIIPKVVDAAFVNSGEIGSMKVAVGDKVKKGEVIATLKGISANKEAKQLKEALKQTRQENKDANDITECDIQALKEELKNLNKQYKSAKNQKGKAQFKSQIVSKKEDIRIANLKYKQQKELQKQDIAYKEKIIQEKSKAKNDITLRAPITGEVVAIAGSAGRNIMGGSAAVRIADMTRPRVKTEYIDEYKMSQCDSAIVEVEGKRYEVEKEEQEVDPLESERGNTPSESYFDFIQKNVSISIGAYATLKLNNNESKNGLVIPSNCLPEKLAKGAEQYVYRVKSGAKERVAVKVGTTTDAYVQILSGLKEGDEVYVLR